MANELVSGILDAVTGGWYSYPSRLRDYKDRAGLLSTLKGAMPTPDNYAPPQYAPPVGEDGVPLDDPMARIPYATRFAEWAKDYNRAGGDLGEITSLYNAVKPDVSVDAESGVQTASDGRIVGQLPRREYINNFLVEPYGDNAPGYLPVLPNATIPDGRGGVIPVAGAVAAEAGRAAALSGAEAQGRAPYTFVDVPDPQGRPRKAAVSAVAGGDFRGPTPDESAFASQRGQEQATQLKALEEQQRTGAGQLTVLNEAMRMLKSGNVITGLGAEARLAAERALALAGDPKAKARVADTETFQNVMARQVLDVIKGLGANPSNADREFLQKIAAGDISLNDKTLERLIGIQQQQIRSVEGKVEQLRGGVPSGATASGTPTAGGRQGGTTMRAPRVGEVQQGYRYNGGNPADPRSWSRQ